MTGDSAGGNLALGLLSHIAHPHPDVSIPRVNLNESEKLSAAALLCPWVDFSNGSNGSFETNKYQDVFGPVALKNWSDAFLYGNAAYKGNRGTRKEDWYNEPVRADAAWWEGVKGIIESVCVVVGSDEVFLDCKCSESFSRGFMQVMMTTAYDIC